VRRQLKARAAAAGKSLNRYVLDLLEREVARPTGEEVLHRASRRTERSTASAIGALGPARQEREDSGGPISVVIVVDCAAVVDALTAAEGTDALRDVLASAELSAPQPGRAGTGLTSTSSHHAANPRV
jgi:hypothetical protein